MLPFLFDRTRIRQLAELIARGQSLSVEISCGKVRAQFLREVVIAAARAGRQVSWITNSDVSDILSNKFRDLEANELILDLTENLPTPDQIIRALSIQPATAANEANLEASTNLMKFLEEKTTSIYEALDTYRRSIRHQFEFGGSSDNRLDRQISVHFDKFYRPEYEYLQSISVFSKEFYRKAGNSTYLHQCFLTLEDSLFDLKDLHHSFSMAESRIMASINSPSWGRFITKWHPAFPDLQALDERYDTILERINHLRVFKKMLSNKAVHLRLQKQTLLDHMALIRFATSFIRKESGYIRWASYYWSQDADIRQRIREIILSQNLSGSGTNSDQEEKLSYSLPDRLDVDAALSECVHLREALDESLLDEMMALWLNKRLELLAGNQPEFDTLAACLPLFPLVVCKPGFTMSNEYQNLPGGSTAIVDDVKTTGAFSNQTDVATVLISHKRNDERKAMHVMEGIFIEISESLHRLSLSERVRYAKDLGFLLSRCFPHLRIFQYRKKAVLSFWDNFKNEIFFEDKAGNQFKELRLGNDSGPLVQGIFLEEDIDIHIFLEDGLFDNHEARSWEGQRHLRDQLTMLGCHVHSTNSLLPTEEIHASVHLVREVVLKDPSSASIQT